MEDKIYVLSDGSVQTVSPDDEKAFKQELKENGLTATIQSDMSGNQTSSTGSATVGQNPQAQNQEVSQPQQPPKVMELSSEDGSLDLVQNKINNDVATNEEREAFLRKYIDDIQKKEVTTKPKRSKENIKKELDQKNLQLKDLEKQYTDNNYEKKLSDAEAKINSAQEKLTDIVSNNDAAIKRLQQTTDQRLESGYSVADEESDRKLLQQLEEEYKTYNTELDNNRANYNSLYSEYSNVFEKYESGRQSYNLLLDEFEKPEEEYSVVDGIFKAVKDFKNNPEERERSKTFLKNIGDNIPEQLIKALVGSNIAAQDLILGEEIKTTKDAINFLVANGGVNMKNLGLLFARTNSTIRDKVEDVMVEQFEFIDKINKEGVDVGPLGTLKQKYTGEGLVQGVKKGKASDIIGGFAGAISGTLETVIPAAMTGGATLPMQIIGPMYTDFNMAKAESLYGDDPNALDKLVENGETEIATPLGLGFLAYGLERVGVRDALKIMKINPLQYRGVSNYLTSGLKEGTVEFLQVPLETMNRSLASGKTFKQASIEALNDLKSEKGLEAFLNGVIGQTAIGSGTRLINRGLISDDASLAEVNSKIKNISKLNQQKNETTSKSLKNAIDLDIKDAEQDLKDYVVNRRKINEILTDKDKDELITTLRQKENISKDIDILKEENKRGNITNKQLGYGIRSLNNQNKKLNEKLKSIRSNAIENAAKRTTETVKKQIEELKLDGKVIEMTSEQISNMDIGKNIDRVAASQEFGFIRQFKDGSFEIVINKDKPAVGTASHEFLHAVLNKTLFTKDKDGNYADRGVQNDLAKALKQHVSTLKGEGFEKLNARLSAYKDDANLGEETITVMSEAILDGSLKFNEGFFTKIGDIVRRFLQRNGLKEIKFNTGRDVFNFIKDYNETIKTGKVDKAIVKVAKEGAEGTLLNQQQEGAVQDDTKFSLDAKIDIDDLGKMGWTAKSWKNQGANFAIKEMQENKLLDRLIASKLKVPMSIARTQEFVAKVYAELTPHAKRFNPEINDSFFGWINSQIANKAGNVYNREYKVTQRTQDIDARTEEGAPVVQVAADTRAEQAAIDKIGLTQEAVQQYSKLRKQLGLDDNMLNKVRDAVVKTFGTRLPNVTSKKFRTELEKSFRTELKKPIQDMIGSRANYDNFLKNRFESVYNNLPVETLVQMERNVKPENRIFTKSKRITKPVEVDKLISENKLPKDTNRLSGPQLHTKNKYPGTEKVLAFFRGTDMQSQLGYEVGASTLGTRKDKLAMEIGVELGFDATMEVVQQPEVQQKRIDILDLEGRQVLDNDIAMIAKQIDRDPTVKFSKRSDVFIEQTTDLLDKLVNAKKFEDIFDSKGRVKQGVKDKGRYLEQVQDAVYNRFLNGDIVLGDYQSKTKIVDILKTIPVKQMGSRSTGFEQAGINVIVNASKKHKGLQALTEIVREGGIPDVYASIYDTAFNIEAKFGESKGPQRGASLNFKTGEGSIINPIVEGLADQSLQKAFKNGAKKLVDRLAELGFNPDVFDSDTKVPKRFHDKVTGKEVAKVSDISTTVDASYIVNAYQNKKIPVDYIEIAGAGMFYLNDRHGIAKELGIPKLEGNFPLKVRIKSASYKEGGKTAGYRYKLTVEPLISPEYLATTSNVSMFDKNFMDKVMNTKAVKVLESKQKVKKANNLIDAFNKQAELIKKQNEIIQKDLERRGYTFRSSKDASVKGQTPSEMIRIIEEDLKKKGYTISGTVSSSEPGRITRGMSTFDFDETVGISENFVIAKKGNDVQRIASDKWPFVGERLAKEGYKFDFSDFNKVTKGKPGPLFQKMKNQIKKYGPENVFILTARAPQSEQAIHDWLKSNGINIPRQNVTGLGKSEGQAKADWMLEKFAEGYNDMYFVDDAITNVKAVKEVLDQLDIKSKVVQAKIKFSKDASKGFNEMLERTKGVGADKVFSPAAARKLGVNKGRFEFFVPPSAEDFKGLIYRFLGKGKQGEQDLQFFKDNLFTPFAKAIRAHDTYKQNMANEWRQLKKNNKELVKDLNKKVKGTEFTNDTAIRVYLWDKAGFEIPGLSDQEKNILIERVVGDKDLQVFAESLSAISRRKEGYIQPDNNWVVQTTASDLNKITSKVGRKEFLSEWIDNKNIIFSKENLNKIEATYGSATREALDNILYRMENGTNRITGKDKNVNLLLDWINGSVGATMFFNMRSALLQTISTANFINMSDNNIFKAGKAFANQPQYWKDFITLFNSDMLKQRRRGLQLDVNSAELTKTFSEGGTTSIDKTRAVFRYLLQVGFTPTQLADSFAIASGGATFYRNRIDKYIKEGMSKKKATDQAFLDFQEVAEETQQSSRPDLISAQQAGPLGRIILAWANTPMQMTRLTKKALSDLVNRRGDAKANISRIIYYGVMQNIIFGTLQTGLGFMLFGNDEEDEEQFEQKTQRVLNGALDSLLRGTGIYGAGISTLKNTMLQWQRERNKDAWKRENLRIAQSIIDLSPPMGSKMRKVMRAVETEQYNQGVGAKIPFRIENPNYAVAANITEALTNIPVARALQKANNLEEAITGNHQMWQRIALASGWSTWNINIEDEELIRAREAVEKDKAEKRKKEREQKKITKEAIKESKAKTKTRCIALKRTGGRCKNMTNNKNGKCYAHQ